MSANMTLQQTITEDLAYTRRLLDAYHEAPYLIEVITPRAVEILRLLAEAWQRGRPCGILLIALRLDDPALWSMGRNGRLPGLPEELTQRLSRMRGVIDPTVREAQPSLFKPPALTTVEFEVRP